MANSQCGEQAYGAGVSVNRFFTWSNGGNGYQDGGMTAAYPTAGGDVDGVTLDGVDSRAVIGPGFGAFYAVPGMPIRIEAGAAISAGQLLQTDANGRAVPQTTGKAVARALQAAAGASTIIGAVFTSGR